MANGRWQTAKEPNSRQNRTYPGSIKVSQGQSNRKTGGGAGHPSKLDQIRPNSTSFFSPTVRTIFPPRYNAIYRYLTLSNASFLCRICEKHDQSQKHKHPSHAKSPASKAKSRSQLDPHNSFTPLEFGAWDFFGTWKLELGIWPCPRSLLELCSRFPHK